MDIEPVHDQPVSMPEGPATKIIRTDDSMAAAPAPAPANRKDFEAVFPKFVEDVMEHVKQYNVPDNALEWFQNNLYHNTLGGKLNRGLSVLDTASTLLSRPLHPEEYHHLAALGWMTELLQAYFLVADDIMDASPTRRGQPSWYKMPSVGMIAINDAFMLESTVWVLLKKYFRTHPAYVDFLELFHTVILQTEIGQLCDLLTAPEDVVDLDKFSMAKQRFIVVYKTAYYSFYLPVALALHYLQLATPRNLEQAQGILIPLGEYFQCQDDYLDVYADPETLGKVGTDIMDNKCSWVINAALERASPEQRKTLDRCYGRKDQGMEKECKRVFQELDIAGVYAKYEEEAVGVIRDRIAKVDTNEGLKPEVFEAFLKKIYKRSK